MAKKRNYELNAPKNLTELNKDSMLAYAMAKGDEMWFATLCNNNREVKTYYFSTPNGAHQAGDTYNGFNISVIRREFAKKYFPTLLEKKKKKSAGNETFEEQINRILNKK